MRDFLAVTKALSDETRVRALMALKGGELCLCQLIDLLRLAPSTISKHMTLLSQAGLIEMRKEGRWHFYRLAGNRVPPQVRQALEWALQALRDEPVILGDSERLKGVTGKDLKELSECYRN